VKVRAWSAHLIAVAAHGDKAVQLAFFQAGALAILMRLTRSESSEAARHKVLKALSALVEANPEAEKAFLVMGGLQVLSAFLSVASSPQTRAQIVFFLIKLAREHVGSSYLVFV